MIRNRWGWALVPVVCLGIGACAGLEPLPEGVDGVWKARRPGGRNEIRLDLYLGPMGLRDTDHRRMWLDLGELAGLDESAFRGSQPFTFRLERDAGTFHFEGIAQRRPRGGFHFEPSAGYLDRIAQIGVTEIEQDLLLLLALHGVSEGLVDALLAGGYRDTDAKNLLRLESYGLRPSWIASMSRLAGPPSFRELIKLRRYGVGSHQVDAWVEAELADLPVDDLLRLYRHGFRATDAAVYRGYGFDEVDAWLTFHRNGVSEELIAAIVESGGPELDVSGVVRIHVQGIGPGHIREAGTLIEAGFDWDALVYLWRRGVSTDYAETLIESGWDELDEEAITRLASNGLETDWILHVRAAGGDDLDLDELIRLRHYGVRSRDYEAYARAGFTSIDDIRVFVSSGVEADWVERIQEHLPQTLDAEALVRLRQNDVDARFLERLGEAGLNNLDVEEIVEARRAGLDRWLERRQP